MKKLIGFVVTLLMFCCVSAAISQVDFKQAKSTAGKWFIVNTTTNDTAKTQSLTGAFDLLNIGLKIRSTIKIDSFTVIVDTLRIWVGAQQYNAFKPGAAPGGLSSESAWSIVLNNSGSSAVPTGVKISALTDRTAFGAGDKLMMEESTGELRKIDFSDLPGAGGGISNIVEDTTPQLGGDLDANTFDIQFDDGDGIHDDSDNEQLLFSKTASAVNHFQISNSATGLHPSLDVIGTDANINLTLDGKGTGTVRTLSSNLDITGNIIVSGTVDGKDIATNAAMLNEAEVIASNWDNTANPWNVNEGGLGVGTITGLMQGNGTSAVTGITNSSTVGEVLRVTGASTYAWGPLDLADGDAITNDLPDANLSANVPLINGTNVFTGVNSFQDNEFQINNPANTFQYIFGTAAIVADRTIELPLLTGNDTIVMNAFAATLTNKTIAAGSNTITGIVDVNIDAHTSTKITITAKGQLNSALVYNDQANTFGAFAQRFDDDNFQLDNPANTFQYIFNTNAIVADRIVTLPLLTGGDTFTFNSFAATLTNKTIDSDNNTITNIVNADIKAAAGIVYSKLAFSDNIVAGDIAAGAVTNIEASDMTAFTFKMRNNSGTGDPQDVKISALTDRAAFGSGDKLIIEESTGETRKIDFDDLPGAGGGLSNIVEDTTPQLGGDLDANTFDIQFDDATGIRDDSDNEQLIFQKTTSAINHIEITNAAAAGEPLIAAVGGDTDVSLTLDGKGAGTVRTLSSNLDITGNIIVSGTVDGKDIATNAGMINETETLSSAWDLGTPSAMVGTNLSGTGASFTAGVSTLATVTDNESTAEENPIVFVAGADPDGGTLGLETDGNATYNPSTGTITATEFIGGGVGITGVTASHAGTITWTGTAILETGVAFQFGDASDATLTHTYANTGTNVDIAYSTAAMAVTGALTATNLSGTNTGDEVAADLTTAGVIEIATGTETNTGTDATRAVSPDGLDDWTGSAQVTTLGTIATGVWNGTAVTYANLNFSNNIVAGDIATSAVETTEILDGTVSVEDVQPELDNKSLSYSIIDTVKAADLVRVHEFNFPVTLDSIVANTDVGTATFNFDHRVHTTPRTAGTQILTASLVADAFESTSTFDDNTIPANRPIYMVMSAVSGGAKQLDVTIFYKID